MSKTLHLVSLPSPGEADDARIARLGSGNALWAHLGDGSVFVLGTAADRSVRVLARSSAGAEALKDTQTQVWSRPGATDPGSAIGFAVLIRPSVPKGRIGALLLATAAGQTALKLPRLPSRVGNLVDALAADAGDDLGNVVEAVVECIIKGGARPAEIGFANMLLRTCARPAGFIELVGRLDRESFVQGWSSDLEAGETRLVLSGDALAITTVEAATFVRADLDGRAHGFFGLVAGDARLESVERLFFRTREGWRSLELYGQCLLLSATDVPAYMREGIARGSAPASTIKRLSEVAERFDGRDTVSSLQRPVRLGIDFTTDAEGTGILVSGWLVDPGRHVLSVTLRHRGATTRLDGEWTRLSRPDVTTAFASDPTYAGISRDGRHGFIAFAPSPEAETGPIYLELGLRGGGRAYFPLSPTPAPLRITLERILAVLDPHASSTALVVANQIAPALSATSGPAPTIVRALECGTALADGPLALVVGFDGDAQDLTALLTTLALDRETRSVPIVVATGIDRFDAIGREAQRLAQFYGLSLRLVLAEGIEDSCDALEAGVAGCRSDAVLLLNGHAQPRTVGWLGQLRGVFLAEGSDCLVSPTLLFEDDSIRWAGSWFGAEGGIADRLIGYPVEAIAAFDAMEVVAGTAECCILPRSAFERCRGFSRGYLTTGHKSTDLCLRLRGARVRSVWLPGVSVYLTDERRPSVSAAAASGARMADRLTFERRWAATLSEEQS